MFIFKANICYELFKYVVTNPEHHFEFMVKDISNKKKQVIKIYEGMTYVLSS